MVDKDVWMRAIRILTVALIATVVDHQYLGLTRLGL